VPRRHGKTTTEGGREKTRGGNLKQTHIGTSAHRAALDVLIHQPFDLAASGGAEGT